MASKTFLLVAATLLMAATSTGRNFNYEVRIGLATNSIQGGLVAIPVTVDRADTPITSFRFSIGFDSTLLLYDSFRAAGNLTQGHLTITASSLEAADINDVNRVLTIEGDAGNNDVLTDSAIQIGRLWFGITLERLLECRPAPVRFVWPRSCRDNYIIDTEGNTYLSAPVINDGDSLALTAHWAARDEGLVCPDRDAIGGDRRSLIEFYNGGTDIACAESLDTYDPCGIWYWWRPIGHDPLKSLQSFFVRYYIFGASGHYARITSTGASLMECLREEGDWNGDGITPTLEDMALAGKALCYHRYYKQVICDTPLTATVYVDNALDVVWVKSDCVLGVLLLEFDDSLTIKPANSRGGLFHWSWPCTTRVIMFADEHDGAIPNGELFRFVGNANVVRLEAASFDGKPVECLLRTRPMLIDN